MTIQEFLQNATQLLKKAGVPSARLDCLLLLEDALSLDRSSILAHPEQKITPSKLVRLNKQITQRASHTPLAYIRGKVLFYGREFIVNQYVLVPRPETETMITVLKNLPLPQSPKIIDVGTGSGCIAITVALEITKARVEAYDIDPQTLKIAAKNAQAHKVTIAHHQNDLLETQPICDVIAANLPYVPERYQVNRAAEHEPKHAIFAGKDGLNLYRRFWAQIANLPKKPSFVLTEALPPQQDDLAMLATAAGYKLRQTEDFIQVFERDK